MSKNFFSPLFDLFKSNKKTGSKIESASKHQGQGLGITNIPPGTIGTPFKKPDEKGTEDSNATTRKTDFGSLNK